MATHSCAYIPTRREPNEYLMSEGWSDGMLHATGWMWYQSAVRMDEAIRATVLLGGSPVFAPAGDTGFDIKEIDYIEEGIDDEVSDELRGVVEGVGVTLQALEESDWATALSTGYGQTGLDEKMAMGITLNTTLHTIADFVDVPTWSTVHMAYDLPVLVDALKQYDPNRSFDINSKDYEPDISTTYFYHPCGQWWGTVALPDHRQMWVPLAVAFAIEGLHPRRVEIAQVRALHAQYPDVYARDIGHLAAFDEAMAR